MSMKAIMAVQGQDGKWVMLGDPDTGVKIQKQEFKKVRVAGGKVGNVQYVRGVLFYGRGKRFDFSGGAGKVFAPKTVDELTELNAVGLEQVVKEEGLKVKVGADHEKARAEIRAALAKKEEKKD
jgi:hypothetical protein